MPELMKHELLERSAGGQRKAAVTLGKPRCNQQGRSLISTSDSCGDGGFSWKSCSCVCATKRLQFSIRLLHAVILWDCMAMADQQLEPDLASCELSGIVRRQVLHDAGISARQADFVSRESTPAPERCL